MSQRPRWAFVKVHYPPVSKSYQAGLDCGLHGPNERNCHFGLFCTPAHTREWERGKREGERIRKRRVR